MLLHRYFSHGSIEERLLRWGLSVIATIVIGRVVPKALSEAALAIA
jgi:hypothetical protein